MREYILVLLVAAAVTYQLSGWARRAAIRFGAVAKVRSRDVHVVPTPYFGGVAMLVGVAVAFLLSMNLPFLGRHEIVRHDATWILVAVAVLCAVGVLDDLLDISAITKFAGQVLAAGIVVQAGVRMLWIPLPDRIISLDAASSIVMTVFFVVVCTNAVNFVDGLDGLAAGVVGIGAAAFFTYSYILAVEQDLVRATTASVVSVAIIGVCLGFLPHNVHPSKMFMGDSGSMLLGFLLAISTVSLTGQFDSSKLEAGGGDLLPAYLPLVLPFAILGLPLLDLVLAWIRRANQGNWWFVADKGHLHHQLLRRGYSHRGAVIVMYLWAALLSFGVMVIGLTRSTWVVVAWVAAAIAVVVVTLGPGPRIFGAAALHRSALHRSALHRSARHGSAPRRSAQRRR
ncbi:MraY family glycosyltransferase [Raineyella sp. W15-4]|nr:MraY family glycosyltransferase [Raineyella sp. W15-4]WOQ15521.1 MraY family glycosyltransferase [Raineyella sp. W15-4]